MSDYRWTKAREDQLWKLEKILEIVRDANERPKPGFLATLQAAATESSSLLCGEYPTFMVFLRGVAERSIAKQRRAHEEHGDNDVGDVVGEFIIRGFKCVEFVDAYGFECSLQQSSAIDDTDGSMENPGSSFIWLGRDSNRMHLNRKQVEGLIERLQNWLKAGTFESPANIVERRLS